MFHEFSLPLNLLIFAVSAAFVWAAGSRLAGYADAIAQKTGIGREFLGIMLLGGITSLPEIAVGTTATLQGEPILSVNDVLGSAAINVLILAIADATTGRGALTTMQGSPTVLLQGVLGIVMMALTVGAVLTGDFLVLGVGVWCWLMFATYLGAVWLLAKTRSGDAWRSSEGGPQSHREGDGGEREDAEASSGMRSLIARTVGAGAVILVAGFLLARTGDAMAEQTGLGASFFGAVFLGFSTSLPEISTVIAAVRLKRYEMAISDIFGTNLFNVSIIVLVDALHPGGPVLVAAGRFAAFGALLALVLTAIFLVGMIERRDRTVLRMGIDSLTAFPVYVAGVIVLYTLR